MRTATLLLCREGACSVAHPPKPPPAALDARASAALALLAPFLSPLPIVAAAGLHLALYWFTTTCCCA